MPAVLAVTALLLLALPARAEDSVAVPAACRELAERAGLPLTMTHADAARAVAYIRVMVSQDPAVARCRLALRGY
jgi:predicted secreted protein